MSRLSFTFTKNAVEFLVETARNSMFKDLDPEKAIDIITSVLIGCDREAALGVIKGSLVVNVDEDGSVYATEARTGDTIIGIRATVGGIANKCIDEIDEAISLVRGISYIINNKGYVSIDVPWLALVNSLMDNGVNIPLNGLKIEGKNFESLSTVISEVVRVRNKAIKVIGLAGFVNKNYKLFEDNVDDALFKRIDGKIKNLEEIVSNPHCSVFRTIDSSNFKEIEEELKPCDITVGYNAGWLGPNGDFYGLNGVVSDLLHISISDSLKRQGIIKYDEDKEPDFWMETNGWIKISGCHVFYGLPLAKNVKVTQEQVDKLVLYANSCCNGSLSIGYKNKVIKSSKLKQMDLLMVNKLFNEYGC